MDKLWEEVLGFDLIEWPEHMRIPLLSLFFECLGVYFVAVAFFPPVSVI